MPFAGLKQWGFGVGGIAYTFREMWVEKMLVIKSASLQIMLVVISDGCHQAASTCHENFIVLSRKRNILWCVVFLNRTTALA